MRRSPPSLQRTARVEHRGNRKNALLGRSIFNRRLVCEALEDRCLLSIGAAPELPGMHLVDPNLDNLRGQLVYLDFDGAQNVTYDGPVKVEGIDVPAFQASNNLAGQEQLVVAGVLENIQRAFADVGVVFTLDAPAASVSHSTIYAGGDSSPFAAYGVFSGLAEKLDVGNTNPQDNALVFTDALTTTDLGTYVGDLSALISHEAGHLLGYAHDHTSNMGGLLSEVASTGTLHATNTSNYNIPDDGAVGNWISSSITTSGAPSNATVTSVDLRYQIKHTYIGDLEVWATTQQGSTWYNRTVWDNAGGGTDNIDETETGCHNWDGLSPNRTWYLSADDQASTDSGYIDYFEVWVNWSTPTFTPYVSGVTASGYSDNDGDTYSRDFDFNFSVGANVSGEYVVEVYDEWGNYLGDTGYQSIGTSDTSSFEVDISDHAFYSSSFRDQGDFRLELYDTTNRSSWRWIAAYTKSNDSDLGYKNVESDRQDSFSPTFFSTRITNGVDNNSNEYMRKFDVEWDVDSQISGTDVPGNYKVHVWKDNGWFGLVDEDLGWSNTFSVSGTATDYHGMTINVPDAWGKGEINLKLELYNADNNQKVQTWRRDSNGTYSQALGYIKAEPAALDVVFTPSVSSVTTSGHNDSDGDGHSRDFDFNFSVGANVSGEYVIEVYDEWGNYLGNTGYQSISTSDTSSFEVDISDHAFYSDSFRDQVDYRLEIYDTTNRSSWRWIAAYTKSNDSDLGYKNVESDRQDSFSPTFFSTRITNGVDDNGNDYMRRFDVEWDVDSQISGTDVPGNYKVHVWKDNGWFGLVDEDLGWSNTFSVSGTATDYHGMTINVPDAWGKGEINLKLELYNADNNQKVQTWRRDSNGTYSQALGYIKAEPAALDVVFTPSVSSVTASGHNDSDGDGYSRDFDFNFSVGANVSGEYVIEVYDEWGNYLGDTGYQSIGTSDTSSFEVDISDHAFYSDSFRDQVDYRLELYDTTNRSSWRWIAAYTKSNDSDLGNKAVESDHEDSFTPSFFNASLEGVTDNDGDDKYRSLKVGFDVDSNVLGQFYVKVYDNDAVTDDDLILPSPIYSVNGNASDWHYLTFDVDSSWFEWSWADTADIYLELWNADAGVCVATRNLGTIGGEIAEDDTPEWAILTYLAGDNNLEPYFVQYLDHMEEAAGNDEVAIAVQLDRSPGWWGEDNQGNQVWMDDTSHGNWTTTKRFLVAEDSSSTSYASPSIDIDEVNMGSPSTLTSFIEWASGALPEAKHYALVLADHGLGWPSICTDKTDNDSLSIADVKSAIESSGKTFDTVFLNACLMGGIEVASYLQNVCDYLVFSEANMWGFIDTWPNWDVDYYRDFVAGITNSTTPEGLATSIAQQYYESCTALWQDYSMTISVLDCSKVADVLVKTDAWANAIIPSDEALADCRSASVSAVSFDYDPYYVDLYGVAEDMYQYTGVSAVRTACSNLMNAIDVAVVTNYTNNSRYAGAQGLSVYLPELPYDEYWDAYRSTSFATSHSVDELVTAMWVPEAVLNPEITLSDASCTFSVTYSDNHELSASTIGTGDIRVTGPNGYDRLGTLVQIDDNSDGSPRVATYRVFSPGAQWTYLDNGDYTVLMRSNEVSDTDENFVPAGTLGQFTLTIASISPTARIDGISPNPAQPPSQNITFAGTGSDQDGSIIAWEWSSNLSGVLSTSEDFVQSSKALTVGLHQVSFRVKDNSGLWSTPATASLTVLDVKPTAEISGVPTSVLPGSTFSATLGGYDNDENGQSVVTKELSLDGSVIYSGTDASAVVIAPSSVGLHSLTYRVRDDESSWSQPITREFDVSTEPTNPEIVVECLEQEILDGDTTPSLIDGTDFGTAIQGGAPLTRVFTIRNIGTAPLILPDLPTLPAGYTLVESTIDGPISVGGSATATIQLSTAIVGTFSDEISFSTNDSDENPFNFYVTGRIDAQPTLPTVSINDVTLTEGNSGEKAFIFTITLSEVSSQDVWVKYSFADGTATIADHDYDRFITFPEWEGVRIPAGEISTTATVTVFGDTKVEPDECFYVNLSSPVGATIAKGQGIGTVQNDDGLQLTITYDRSIATDGVVSGVALSPDESKLYVAFWEDSPTSRVQQYSLPDGQLLQTIGFGSYHTHGDVVVSADGNRIFTSNYYYSTVSQVDLANGNAITDQSTADSWPGRVSITPDRSKVLAAVGMDGQGYDANNDSIAVFDIAGGGFTRIASVKLNDEPRSQIGYSADSQYAYVGTFARKSASATLYEIALNGQPGVARSLAFPGVSELRAVAVAGNKVFVSSAEQAKIWVVDRDSWTVTSEILVPEGPATLQVHPDGQHLFAVLPNSRAVVAIDIASGQIVATYSGLGENPDDIEFSNDGAKMYISHRTANGSVMAFDIRVVPQGIVTIASGAGYYERPRINANGEVVWSQLGEGGSQIWSDHRGQISAGPLDRDPEINDGGEIIWRFGDGGQGQDGIKSNMQGVVYIEQGGPIDPYYDTHRINNTGEIIWSSGEEIWSNTRGRLTLSPEYAVNRECAINDTGEVVYVSYNGPSGNTYDILSTSRGFITNDAAWQSSPDINNSGEVVWEQDGQVWSSLHGMLGLGSNPSINNTGEVVWERWDGQDYEIYSSARGQITDNVTNDWQPHINDRGDIVWLADHSAIMGLYGASTPDTTSPSVEINQEIGQIDPTNGSLINFTVIFSESVTDFATGDVTLSGTAGATTAMVTGSGTTYNVTVSGMTGSGTVVATIAADKAHDAAGNPNTVSTSTDNIVFYQEGPFVVTTLEDENDAGYDPNDLSLREALWLSRIFEGDDVITFATGLFTDGSNPISRTITLNGSQLEISDNVMIEGPGQDLLAINAASQSRVLEIGQDCEVSLSGLTVTGGALLGGPGNYDGGGILNAGVLTIDNCTVSNNSSSQSGGGGGLYNSGSVTIAHSSFSGNSAGYGGGIFNMGTLAIEDSTIEQNETFSLSDSSGGGILNIPNSTATIIRCMIADNFSAYGGGIDNVGGTLAITDSTVSRNTANREGGGIDSLNGSLTVTGCTISGNVATGNESEGGGICCVGTGNLSVSGSTIDGNRAEWGGGIYSAVTATIVNSQIHGNIGIVGGGITNYGGPDVGVMSIVNSVVVGNTVSDGLGVGGGVASYQGLLSIVNSTIAGNSCSGNGGGVWSATYSDNPTPENPFAPYTFSAANSIIAMNSGPSGVDVFGQLSGTSGFNVIGNDPHFIRNPSNGGDGWGDNPSTTDTDESANDDYGDLHLRPESVGIEGGSNALAIDTQGNPILTDLDGNPRIVWSNVDMGAYEYVNPLNRAPTNITLSNTSVAENQFAGTVIGVLSGIDPDMGQSDTLTFSLVNGYGDNALFSIDPATKQLKTAAVFDYEAGTSYNIKVRATDTGSPTLTYDEPFAIAVMNLNDAPAATNDTYAVNEDTVLRVPAPGVFSNDSDADSDSLSAQLVAGPSHGILAFNKASGLFSYKPSANYSGTDTFTYQVSDGTAWSNVATVTINVNPVNDAPVAGNDAYTMTGNTALIIAAPGLIGNDTDVDSGSLSAVWVSNPSHGTLSLNANGSFIYTPTTGYTGPDTFTYKVNDGQANSNVATVTITVNPPVGVPPTVESVVINGGLAQRSMVTSILVMFDTVVTFSDLAAAFQVVNKANNNPVSLLASQSIVDGKTAVTLSFTGAGIVGGSLADANYLLKVYADKVHASGFNLDGNGDGTPNDNFTYGEAAADKFFRLFGDQDGDRDVDATDRFAFLRARGKVNGQAGYLWYFDYDNDGDVDLLGNDLDQFNLHYGKKLAF